MPTLHLICGLPGSGKTTLARKLEKDLPALRLTPDEWMGRIVGDGYNEQKRMAVEAVQEDLAHRVMELGVDVILENGFWSKAERDEFRTRATAQGFETRLYFLNVPLDELWSRHEKRNAALPPDTFRVTKANLESWAKMFEAPTSEELA